MQGTQHPLVFLPDNDNNKVQQVPAIADVRAGVHHEPVGQDLQEGLHSKDDEEHVLHLFLKHTENHSGVNLKENSPCSFSPSLCNRRVVSLSNRINILANLSVFLTPVFRIE